jgi:hypothetical protein
MQNLQVLIPDSLHQRIERKAHAIGRTVPELVSLWLWDYEEQLRNGPTSGNRQSGDDRPADGQLRPIETSADDAGL